MKIRTGIKKLLFSALVVSVPTLGYAQPDPGGDPDDTPIPFDGGITLVIAAGVAYGLKQTRKDKERKPEKD